MTLDDSGTSFYEAGKFCKKCSLLKAVEFLF